MGIFYVMLRSLESALEQFLKCMEMSGALGFPQPHLSLLQAGKDQKILPHVAFLAPSISSLHLPTHAYFTHAYF